eukprot:604015-Rhodomonas_salina.1
MLQTLHPRTRSLNPAQHASKPFTPSSSTRTFLTLTTPSLPPPPSSQTLCSDCVSAPCASGQMRGPCVAASDDGVCLDCKNTTRVPPNAHFAEPGSSCKYHHRHSQPDDDDDGWVWSVVVALRECGCRGRGWMLRVSVVDEDDADADENQTD